MKFIRNFLLKLLVKIVRYDSKNYSIRYEIIDDERIRNALLERDKLVEKGKKITEKMEALKEEFTKHSHQTERIKERMKPIVEKLEKGWKLNLFEYTSRVYIDEKDNKVKAEIIDAVEDYKQFYLEKKKKK